MAIEQFTIRTCPHCKETHPAAAFQKNRSRPDGLSFLCRRCRKAARKIYEDANRESLREKDRCRRRNPEKSRAAQARWRAKNKKLANKRAAISRLKKVDQYNARGRAHKLAFPEKVRAHDAVRRARRVSAPGKAWTSEDVADVRRLQKGKCALCRIKLSKRFHRDHVQPLSKGGANDRANLQLLCQPCNLSKGARDPIDHARTLGLLL